MSSNYRNILTIGGSDPSGHAGIQADIQTIQALGYHPLAIPTALTAQNSTETPYSAPASIESIDIALKTLCKDIPIHAIKTGMLVNNDVISLLHSILPTNIPLIIDPVMCSTSGRTLLENDAIETLKHTLFSRTTLLTPNLQEWEILTGINFRFDTESINHTKDFMRHFNLSALLIKGGHRTDNFATDILITHDRVKYFEHPRIPNITFRGTGCCLASSIACYLVQNHSLETAIQRATEALQRAILHAYHIGKHDDVKKLNFTALKES